MARCPGFWKPLTKNFLRCTKKTSMLNPHLQFCPIHLFPGKPLRKERTAPATLQLQRTTPFITRLHELQNPSPGVWSCTFNKPSFSRISGAILTIGPAYGWPALAMLNDDSRHRWHHYPVEIVGKCSLSLHRSAILSSCRCSLSQPKEPNPSR